MEQTKKLMAELRKHMEARSKHLDSNLPLQGALMVPLQYQEKTIYVKMIDIQRYIDFLCIMNMMTEADIVGCLEQIEHSDPTIIVKLLNHINWLEYHPNKQDWRDAQ